VVFVGLSYYRDIGREFIVGYTPDWIPEDELALLKSQPKASPSALDNEKLAMQIFRDNLPLAAEVIGDLMVNGEKESTRLNAAKYITERVLGRVGDNVTSSATDPWDNLFGAVAREPTAEERAAGTRVSRI
jgi:hypothetical protein